MDGPATTTASSSGGKHHSAKKPPINRITWDQFLRFVPVVPPQKLEKKQTSSNAEKNNNKRKEKQVTKKKQTKTKPVLSDKSNKNNTGHQASKHWDEKVEQLKAYKATHGDCLVPYFYKENKSLGRWVSKTRCKARDGQLERDRIAQLKSIGFPFEVGNNGR